MNLNLNLGKWVKEDCGCCEVLEEVGTTEALARVFQDDFESKDYYCLRILIPYHKFKTKKEAKEYAEQFLSKL